MPPAPPHAPAKRCVCATIQRPLRPPPPHTLQAPRCLRPSRAARSPPPPARGSGCRGSASLRAHRGTQRPRGGRRPSSSLHPLLRATATRPAPRARCGCQTQTLTRRAPTAPGLHRTLPYPAAAQALCPPPPLRRLGQQRLRWVQHRWAHHSAQTPQFPLQQGLECRSMMGGGSRLHPPENEGDERQHRPCGCHRGYQSLVERDGAGTCPDRAR
mmetsp:Transcript_48839/g.116028  ORF Transcript_48839/g.116028 Transcript_48839/m.116028 type:complete len:214 (-) Transcript_48839:265-906(-)